MEFVIHLFWMLVGGFIVYQGIMFAIGFFIFIASLVFFALQYVFRVIVNGVKNT